MKNKKPNATQIWKHFEDFLVPRLHLSITDRAVYSHLIRHSGLEGRTRLRFSISWLARGVRLSTNPARWAVRRLIAHGALRLLERSKAGHVVEVRLPDEIRATCHKKIRRRDARPLLTASTSRRTSSRPRLCATPSMCENADAVSIACVGLRL